MIVGFVNHIKNALDRRVCICRKDNAIFAAEEEFALVLQGLLILRNADFNLIITNLFYGKRLRLFGVIESVARR